ncbi:YncE family protein [Motiliproteus sp.]|uniref:YncE family protein n=1 Tax=Motiliproteus sp. TaxID=1898955 RepID=UPI003BAAD844
MIDRFSKAIRAVVLAALSVTSLASHAAQAGDANKPTSSSSIVQSVDKQFLYTANFDGGSLTRTAIADPKDQQEVSLGRDLRRVALSDDGSVLAVTSYLDKQVLLLAPDSLELQQSVETGRRPFAVIYDSHNRWFWVTEFEEAKLIAIDHDGAIVKQLDTAETPRGLAITADQRLLVTHAMTGQLSIYDLKAESLPLLKRIDLAVKQDPDQFVSQGLPRLLDDIAISPDGTEAWLPHVLWNFDHPFQFQSTVFPAVSVIDLTPGAEQERTDNRKELFRQINIIDNANRTRIVSNPADAEFSADGKKLFVTLAASEDLMVVDLSRRANKNKKRSKRRKGKQSQGGAQVTQILRHLPGDNPRGLLVDERTLYVQNAMSQDVTSLDAGGSSSFARVKLDTHPLFRTVAKDPYDRNLRNGTRLFHSANTSESPQTPIAGDFWMSCSSCHLDGFNFTNRFLVEGHFQDKKDNAVSGHANLKTMLASATESDLMRLIRDTQGGLGHDDRDGAIDIDPDAKANELPEQAVLMAKQLKRFIMRPHNLPYLSTWLRVKFDNPNRKLVHPKEWTSSVACSRCHSDLFDQWVDSNHRLMGESNPYYRVMEDVAAAAEGEGFRRWCVACHSPQRLTSGLPFRGEENHMFEKGGTSIKQAYEQGKTDLDEGTGCLFCHRITEMEDPGGNAPYTVDLKNREQYVFEESSIEAARWLGDKQINAKPEVHAESYLQPFYKDERYCKGCHNEFAPGSGALIVDTWGEWAASSFNNPDDPSKHRGCIDCHLVGDISKIGQKQPGLATDGGAIQENLVTHQFTGANHHLVGLRNKEQERMSLELLRTSAEIEQRLVDGVLEVVVHNRGAGHALPTGVADFRQFWLEVRVSDAEGNEIYRSGVADDKGNLPDDSRLFMKVFGDAEGNPVKLHFWRFEKMLSDTRIPADGSRTERFELPDAKGPLTIRTRLLYRIYPQWVTDAVRQKVPDLPEPPIVELNRLEERFDG